MMMFYPGKQNTTAIWLVMMNDTVISVQLSGCKFWFICGIIVATRTPVAGAEGSTQTDANVPVN